MDEALWRVSAFVDAGADIVFIDALETVEEMQRFCRAVPTIPKVSVVLRLAGCLPLQPCEAALLRVCSHSSHATFH